MTEYDFSPEAYERHIATQNRIAAWVERTEEHRPQFGNALKVPPSVGSAVPDDTHTIPQRPPNRRHHSSDALRTFVNMSTGGTSGPAFDQRPPNRRHRSSDTLRTYVNTGGIHPGGLAPVSGVIVGATDVGYAPNHRSQPHSRSSSRHRPSKRDPSPAYLVKVPQVPTQTYVYAPSGWVPGQGLVIVPTNGRDMNVVMSPPGPSPTPQHAYQPSNLGPGVPTTYAHHAQTVYPPNAYSQPIAVPPTAPSGYPHAHAHIHTHGYPGAPYIQNIPPIPGPHPGPYSSLQSQAPGPTPLRPEMFGGGATVESGKSVHGRRIRKLKRTVSEVWPRGRR